MKTRESLLTDCKNQIRKIVVKFYLWGKFKVAGCWEIFSGLRKKKGGTIQRVITKKRKPKPKLMPKPKPKAQKRKKTPGGSPSGKKKMKEIEANSSKNSFMSLFN